MTGPSAEPASRLALFDFDDTLSDRVSAFRWWATRWLDRHGVTAPDALDWMCEVDDGGYTSRDQLFADARDRFGLSYHTADEVADYQATSHDGYHHEPELVAGLQRLVDAGWRIGIVTNGGVGQDEKIDAVGIRPLLSCAVVSGTVGIRKPDAGIFHLAVEQAGGPGPDTPWMVGDHERNDVAGAQAAGLRTMWVSHGRAWEFDGVTPDSTVADLPSALARLEDL